MLTNAEIPLMKSRNVLFSFTVVINMNNNTFIILITAPFIFLVSWYISSLITRVGMETCLISTCRMATNDFGVVSSFFNAAFSYLIRFLSYFKVEKLYVSSY